MNTASISLRRCALAALVSVAAVGMAAPVARAQTFAGKPYLTPDPGKLRAIVYPSSDPGILLICYEHEGKGAVHIFIRDQKGSIVQDQWESSHFFAQRFDLSSLPSGLYTIELATLTARQTKTIRLEPPTMARIVVVPDEPTPVMNEVSLKQ